MKPLYSSLRSSVDKFHEDFDSIDELRKSHLNLLSMSLAKSIKTDTKSIIFICTHNSRRSIMSQVWAQVAAYYYDLPYECYSGGTEVTAFYPSAMKAIKKMGFKVEEGKKDIKSQTDYYISYAHGVNPIHAFSKKFQDAPNPSTNFNAIVNCSKADESCPSINGAVNRLLLIFKDPKKSDGTEKEEATYMKRCEQIGIEMFYLFSKVSNRLK